MQSVELHTEAAGAKAKLAKLEDDAHTSGDPGIQALTVRKNTAAATSGADGDYQPLITDTNGLLHVNASGVAVPVTDNAGSLTVDNAGTFAVQATLAAGAAAIAKAEDVASADADVGVAAMAVRKATPANTSGSDGDYEFFQMSAGRLWVDPSGVTLTVASHAVTNAGTFVVQENGAALTALQLIDDTVFVDDAAFSVGSSKVNAVGYLADETSTDSVDEGDVGAARMTLDRKLIVTVEPHTAGGWDTFMATSGDGSTALTNTAQAVKASAGKLGGWYIYNPNATVAYVIVWNVATGGVTVGTTNPKLVIPIPATSAANLEIVNGVTFDTAITVAATTTGGGNTAPGTALEANFLYK